MIARDGADRWTRRISTCVGWSVPVALALVWIYGPHWSAGFVYVDWRSVAGAQLWYQRPLTQWTWQIVRTPLASHLLNFGLHGLCSVLVGLLAYRLGLSLLGAVTSAAIFALAAIQIEPVAWATGRADLLATFFVLVACVLTSLPPRLAIVVGVAVIWGAALAAKESAISIVALVHLVRRDRITPWLVGLASLIGLGLVWLRFPAPTLSWALEQAGSAYRLLWLTAVPIGLNVVFDPLPHFVNVVALGLLGALVIWSWQFRQTVMGIGGLWTAFTILPRLVTVTPGSLLNAHQWYPVMVGPALIVGAWSDARSTV